MSLWRPALLAAADSLLTRPLKVYLAAQDLWTQQCDEDWGFAYHLERWFRRLLVHHAPGMVVGSPEEADYVYVAHCAMNVYFSLKQSRHQRQRSQRQTKGVRSAEHGEGDAFHTEALQEVDATYLAGEVLRSARADSAVRVCESRAPVCKLLFVNMAFGRDELTRFDAAVGRSAVFITTAGAEPRIAEHMTAGVPIQDTQPSSCSCPLHCKPRLSLGPLDVVVPFAGAHNSTSGRTGIGGRRDLLAVFVGSNTSCSRDEIFKRYSDQAHARTHGIVVSQRVMDEAGFDRLARRSKFCLVPDGHWPATMRLPAVVAKGCVPVVISNRVELPFNDLIDWSRVSLRLREGQIRDLIDVLQGVTTTTSRVLQNHMPVLAEALDYQHPRFHMLLLASLAARRVPQAASIKQQKFDTVLFDNVRFDKDDD